MQIHLSRNASLLAVVSVVVLVVWGGPEVDGFESQLTQSPKATDPSWVVKLLYPVGNKNQECTGSVLNERWILTSAHCLQGSGSSGFWMFYAGGTTSSGGRARFYRHPQYDDDETAHDVGLVYLQEKPLDISSTRQAKLFTDSRRPWRDDTEPDEFAMSAWGLGSDPGVPTTAMTGRSGPTARPLSRWTATATRTTQRRAATSTRMGAPETAARPGCCVAEAPRVEASSCYSRYTRANRPARTPSVLTS